MALSRGAHRRLDRAARRLVADQETNADGRVVRVDVAEALAPSGWEE